MINQIIYNYVQKQGNKNLRGFSKSVVYSIDIDEKKMFLIDFLSQGNNLASAGRSSFLKDNKKKKKK